MSKIPINSDTVYAARYGDKAAMNELISSLAPTVESIASGYVGRCPMSRSDLIQEGMIGLFKAVRDYDSGRDASFATFADLCVSRQMYTAVQASRRQKHIPLNTYISLNGSVSGEHEGEEEELINRLAVQFGQSPEEVIIDKENVDQLEKTIEKELSSFEKQVLDLYLTGMGYQQIAKVLGKDDKSTDNALQRLKNKLKKHLKK